MLFGPGPSMPSFSSIGLGSTYDKKRVGRPHHLWLVDDRFGGVELYPDPAQPCGQLFRRLIFYVVDVENRKVGYVQIRERVPDSYTDSCSGRVVQATTNQFLIGPHGLIGDVLNTGCDTNGNSAGGDCGFTSYPGYIEWVPRNGSTPVNLGTFHRDIRYSWIGVNGRYTRYPADAQFFP